MIKQEVTWQGRCDSCDRPLTEWLDMLEMVEHELAQLPSIEEGGERRVLCDRCMKEHMVDLELKMLSMKGNRAERKLWRPSLNRERYKLVISYLMWSGATEFADTLKLFTLLYYIDFFHFERYKEAVTGEVYERQSLGPYPVHGTEILREMKEEGLLLDAPRGVRIKAIYKTIAEPELRQCSDSERAILEEVVQRWASYDAFDILEMDKKKLWRMVKIGEEIPYTLAFYGPKLEQGEEGMYD